MLSKKVNHERIYGTCNPIDKQYKPNEIIITTLLSLKKFSLTWNLTELFPIDIIYYILLIVYTAKSRFKCKRIDCMKKYINHIWKYNKFNKNELKTLYTNIYHCFGNNGKDCHNLIHIDKFFCNNCEKVYCKRCVHICDKEFIRCLDCCECQNLIIKPQHLIITKYLLTLEILFKRVIPKDSDIQYKSFIYDIIKKIYRKECCFYYNSKRLICLKDKCHDNFLKKIWKYNINPQRKYTFNHCGNIEERCHKIGLNFHRCWNCNTFICNNCVKRYWCYDNDNQLSYTTFKKSCSGCYFTLLNSDCSSEHTDYSAEERSLERHKKENDKESNDSDDDSNDDSNDIDNTNNSSYSTSDVD